MAAEFAGHIFAAFWGDNFARVEACILYFPGVILTLAPLLEEAAACIANVLLDLKPNLQMAMGQNPVPPVNFPIPTKIDYPPSN